MAFHELKGGEGEHNDNAERREEGMRQAGSNNY
jgi:hypothetical protein